MRELSRAVLVLTALAISTAPVWAQRGPGGGFGGPPPLMLLTQKSVQEELKLSDDQVSKLKELAGKQFAAFKGFQDLSTEEKKEKFRELGRASSKAIGEVLSADQRKRFRQISLQLSGADAFRDKEVVEALKITNEQKERISSIQDEARQEMATLFKSEDKKGRGQKMQEVRKATAEKVMKVLTDEQRTQWKELTGTPFKGEIRFGPPGGGRTRSQGQLSLRPSVAIALLAQPAAFRRN